MAPPTPFAIQQLVQRLSKTVGLIEKHKAEIDRQERNINNRSLFK